MYPEIFHFDVHLYDRNTGERQVYEEPYEYRNDPDFDPVYLYEDGNFSCDCNRSMFMYGDESRMLDCNPRSNRIVVEKLIVRETGEVVYSEPVPEFN